MAKQHFITDRTALQILFISTLLALLSGCATGSDEEKIGDAQACLDKATATSAESCLEPISGVTSAKAQAIRCSVEYVKREYDQPAKLLSIFTALAGNNESSGNPMVAAMSELAFSTLEAAQLTESYCAASGSPGLILLSSFTVMSTVVATTVGNIDDLQNAETPEEREALMQDAWENLSEESDEVIGQTAKTLASSYCSSATAEESVCKDINSSVSDSGSNAEIGAKVACFMTHGEETLRAPSTDAAVIACQQLISEEA